jgi:hypothetical protein
MHTVYGHACDGELKVGQKNGSHVGVLMNAKEHLTADVSAVWLVTSVDPASIRSYQHFFDKRISLCFG